MTQHRNNEVKTWTPWMIYTWTSRQLQLWFDSFGSFAMYDGKSWKPKTKNLGVGRYEVRFEEYQHV